MTQNWTIMSYSAAAAAAAAAAAVAATAAAVAAAAIAALWYAELKFRDQIRLIVNLANW